MIAAILLNGLPVEVTEMSGILAFVTSLGRDNIGQSYVGGWGYMGTKFTSIAPANLVSVAQFDETACPEYQNWQKAMSDVDRLIDNHDPAVGAALDIEEETEKAFIAFVHSHSLQRKAPAIEIAPLSPQLSKVWGGVNAHVSTARMAIHGEGGQG